ncbi:MAG: copper-binding protein [Rhodothermales bacterium]
MAIRRTTLAALVVFLSTILLSSACATKEAEETPTTRTFSGEGVVKVITPSRSFVQIQHGDIPGFMEAMSMHFAVADTSVLTGIAVADSVVFDIEAGPNGVVVTRILRVER